MYDTCFIVLVIDCGNPNVADAVLESGSTTYDSTVKMKCSTGFSLEPTDHNANSFPITCGSERKWTKEQKQCQRKYGGKISPQSK